ncbi:ATP-binding protein [Rhodocyclus tenuis]|uniref:ATP-binding protein n=1 Tax=Rhodocyclus tenuis TaxID=1066 RepID=UPI001908E97D|nr:ATP-binding protein [Rhodocyclus tenuis]MBK1681091.1 hypothetical protein [Rhodocyclus tenuis]
MSSTATAADSAPGYSLRRRLLWLLLSTIAVLWGLIAAAVFVRAHDMADELFDTQMTQMASSLLDASAARPDALPASLAAVSHGGAPDFVFQLWRLEDEDDADELADGKGRATTATLLVRSAAAPSTPLVDGDGFREHLWGKELWRFVSLRDAAGHYQAQVGQRHELRYVLAREAAQSVLMPLLIGLPLLALAIWLAVGSALRPLSAATAAVAARRPEALDALAIEQPPAEVLPLIDALNALFARIRRTLDSERQFTANAAHELRTPLAALKTHAQVALRAENDAERRYPAVPERRHALEQVIAGVDRMTRLTEQLLLLARLDPEGTTLPRRPLDLAALAIDVCAQLDGSARAQGVEIGFASVDSRFGGSESAANGASFRLDGAAELLGALVRNLVDNAISHARGNVTVALLRTSAVIELTVDDDGPGIPEEQRRRALERFERLGERGGGGSGLGLSISARIAQLHGGDLALAASPRDGLRACVRLPAGDGEG